MQDTMQHQWPPPGLQLQQQQAPPLQQQLPLHLQGPPASGHVQQM
jgi:hypothetical protein